LCHISTSFDWRIGGMRRATPALMKARRPLLGRPDNAVGTLVRRNFVSVGPHDTVLDADRIMRLARIRHLPVVESGRLVGLLSHRDVLDASIARLEKCDGVERADHLRGIAISEVMRRDPYTVTEATALGEAAQHMLRLKIGCLPVVRPGPGGEELVGLVTESDLLRAAYAPEFDGASD
jgi:CBS domain-containing membrane protein